MKSSVFKSLKLKHGDTIVIEWYDTTSIGSYAYKPDADMIKQYGKFSNMGWVIRYDDKNLELCTDIELRSDDVIAGSHPYREVLKIEIGGIDRIGLLKEPKWIK